MSNHAKMKGKLAGFFHTPIRLGIFLILVNVLIYFMHWPSGIVLSIFLAVYFVIVIYQYVNNRAIIRNELISFATQYGQVQKQLLKNLDLPYAVLDETGRIVWTNYEFERVAGTDKLYRRQISAVFPSLTKDTLPTGEDDVRMQIDYESSNYRIEMRRIPLDSMAEDSDILDATGYDGALIALYLFNETAVRLALQEVDDQSVVIGFIYMDNYEEALDSVEDVKRSLLIALIDRKVNFLNDCS